MWRETWFVTTVICAVACRTVYFVEPRPPTIEEVGFLKKYGYLQEDTSVDFTDGAEAVYTTQSLAEALKKMQAFAGLPQTGTLDVETKKLFQRKRCGVKDIESPTQILRNKRYILQQGWNKHSITYRVINGSSTLDKSRVESLMEEGFAVWAPHGMLRIRKVEKGPADIEVSFAAGDHGDGFPFDGPGRVVAHAFPPPHGAMHFDDDELWGGDPDAEDDDITDFFAVAVHEIGHALGLSHSNEKESVMYPYYQVPIEKLHMDDILGMHELYLKGETAHNPEGTESSVLSHSSLVPRFTKPDSDEMGENFMPDLCMTNYDTVQVIRGKIYVFEEEWVWVLRDRNVLEDGYPKRFHEVFIGLPAHINVINTIYEKHNRDIVIFSGRNYWEFTPSFRLIIRGNLSVYHIPPEVPGLTTVFISNYNNKTYLIEEGRYWRFDELTETMDEGYPREMSTWREVPYPVDAAIVWKGDTYFFQGPRFWRFDNRLIKAHRYYPLPTAQIWFNCDPSADMNTYVTNDGP